MDFERIVEINNKTLDDFDRSIASYPSVFDVGTVQALREAIDEYRNGTPNLDVVFFLATQLSIFRSMRLWESFSSTLMIQHSQASAAIPRTPNWY